MPTWDSAIGSAGGSQIIRLNASENVNEAGNYSTVSWNVQLINWSHPSWQWYNGSSSSWSINIGGHTASGNTTYDFRGGQVLTIASGTTGAIYHNANGEITINASASFSGAGGYPLKSGSAGGGWTLTNFDRKPTTPSNVVATVNADKSISVDIQGVSSPAGAATYYLQYATSTDSGATWTAFGNQIQSTSNVFIYTSLQPGFTYKFRGFASNTDGTGGTKESNAVLLPAGFKIKTAGGLVDARTVKIKAEDGTWKDVRTFKIKTAGGWVNTV